MLSPPMRGRGSKHGYPRQRLSDGGRPPCGGVDRNFAPFRSSVRSSRRPPCGGVDRNNPRLRRHQFRRRSPPMRGRGSKQRQRQRVRAADRRPPCGGVDRNYGWGFIALLGSSRPPCGGVDRNLGIAKAPHPPIVAPHAGAWIETVACRSRCASRTVAPHAGAWIETWRSRSSWREPAVAPHAGAWIETRTRPGRRTSSRGRPPCGGVDRNCSPAVLLACLAKSPPMRRRGSKPRRVWPAVWLLGSPSKRGRDFYTKTKRTKVFALEVRISGKWGSNQAKCRPR